jgi:opacity protein-like surface antigen
MKQFFIILGLLGTLCLFTTQYCYSQVHMRLGIDGGVNIASQSYSRNVWDQPQASRIGFAMGGIVEIEISDLLSIQIEPRYTQRGTKFKDFYITGDAGPEILGTADLVDKLAYVEIPILIKVKFGKAEIIPILFAGPNIGILVSANQVWDRFDVEQVNSQQSNNVGIRSKYKSIDFCLDLGGGVEYSVDSDLSILASARYSMGLTDLNNDTKNMLDLTIRSSGINILVGLLVGL